MAVLSLNVHCVWGLKILSLLTETKLNSAILIARIMLKVILADPKQNVLQKDC